MACHRDAERGTPADGMRHVIADAAVGGFDAEAAALLKQMAAHGARTRLLAGDGAALAATITVDVAYDESAPWPSVPGRCSFHDAIKAANGDAAVQGCPAGSGTDTIDKDAAAARGRDR